MQGLKNISANYSACSLFGSWFKQQAERHREREREIVKQGGGKKKEWKMEDQKGKPKEKI